MRSIDSSDDDSDCDPKLAYGDAISMDKILGIIITGLIGLIISELLYDLTKEEDEFDGWDE